uniref:DB domain-containing protein n=1 Tax=Panagrellus redivivus TaxID=6233 RepID=A0A7E4VW00_PANRE
MFDASLCQEIPLLQWAVPSITSRRLPRGSGIVGMEKPYKNPLLTVRIVQDNLVCTSQGVCGGGCAPPPVQCVQSSCQPGYSCGQYGCARTRAHSALTKKDGLLLTDEEFANSTAKHNNIFGFARNTHAPKLNYTTYSRLTNPNYLFRQCCENRHLPDACLSKCHFNSYTKDSLQEMFFKNDPCPVEAAADIQYCAAQGRDHRKCCAHAGVGATIAGEKCMLFCDQRPGRVTKLNWDYLPCYDRFESIKRCFYDEVKSVAERRYAPLLDKSLKISEIRK